MWGIVGGVGWAVCAVLAYLVQRTIIRKEEGKWTKKDRANSIAWSIFGPVLLFTVGTYLVRKQFASDEEASW